MNIVSRGGRGVEWSGDACVAHGEQGSRTQGSPARFTKYLPLRKRGRPVIVR